MSTLDILHCYLLILKDDNNLFEHFVILKAKVAHKRSGKKDLYATLGVTSAASEDEIKKVRTCDSYFVPLLLSTFHYF